MNSAPTALRLDTIGTGFIGSERMHDYVAHAAAEQSKTKEEFLDQIHKPIPMRRIGRPEELAALIVFL